MKALWVGANKDSNQDKHGVITLLQLYVKN